MDTFQILYKKEDLVDKIDILADLVYKLGTEIENGELDINAINIAISKLYSPETTGHNPFGFYLMAVAADDTPAGWMLLSQEINPTLGGLRYMIQTTYVEKQYRKQGWFTALFLKAKELAGQDEHWKCLSLCVEKGNETAKTVYSKMGMNETDFSWYENDYFYKH